MVAGSPSCVGLSQHPAACQSIIVLPDYQVVVVAAVVHLLDLAAPGPCIKAPTGTDCMHGFACCAPRLAEAPRCCSHTIDCLVQRLQGMVGRLHGEWQHRQVASAGAGGTSLHRTSWVNHTKGLQQGHREPALQQHVPGQ